MNDVSRLGQDRREPGEAVVGEGVGDGLPEGPEDDGHPAEDRRGRVAIRDVDRVIEGEGRSGKRRAPGDVAGLVDLRAEQLAVGLADAARRGLSLDREEGERARPFGPHGHLAFAPTVGEVHRAREGDLTRVVDDRRAEPCPETGPG